jgi:hypothetical protein
MRIVLLGNCQLQCVGSFLSEVFRHRTNGWEVTWNKPIYLLEKADAIPLYSALDRADHIYCHRASQRWGIYSTASLGRSFALKIVPTLVSPTAVPQAGKFARRDFGYKEIRYADFRVLQLYLDGCSAALAELRYRDVLIDPARMSTERNAQIDQYEKQFASGEIIFDYAARLRQLLCHSNSAEPYFTFDHPKNSELEWLLNQILPDLGLGFSANLQTPDILTDSRFPSLLGTTDPLDFVLDSKPMSARAAISLYYSIFDTFDESDLAMELASSLLNKLTAA